MSSDEIRRAIADLPEGDPAKCEGLIRSINDQITNLQDPKEKNKLYNELKAVGCMGLHEDLKEMMERNGFHLEGLDLVVKYLTKVPELAQYFYINFEEVVEKAGLKIVQRRLGPDLEVLGGLVAAKIDVTQEWVKKLCKKAPSLQALARLSLSELKNYCQGADEGEKVEVRRLAASTEPRKKQLPACAIPQDGSLEQQNQATKAADKEKLEKAKELMNEAKAMAAEQSEAAKQIVNEKIAAIMDKLDLPPHWFKADTAQPEKLFQQLEDIIQQCSNVVETGETYKSEVEVIKKASAGRALCGIYHSEYEAPKPAAVPLIQAPESVTLTSPNSAQEISYMKFSEKGAAADYVRTVESSSTNIGFGVAGFYGLFVGEVKGARGSERQTQADHSIKTSTTSASVIQYIRRATKTFQLDLEKMMLSMAARKMAISFFQDKKASAVKQEKSARLFLERYGSHLPAGVQTLGGVFFSIVDAESKSATETSKLTEAAVAHLTDRTSVGFLGGAFGIGGSVTGDHTSPKGRNVGRHRERDNESFTYSVKSMGPPATNAITFQKLLSYNSTWALIDRGPFQGYIPVWELLRDLGGTECEAAARVIEETWRIDEKKRKEDFEAKTWCGTRREESGRSNTDIPDGRQGARPKVHYSPVREKHDLVILDCNTADESIRAVRQMMEDLRPELNLSSDPPVVRGSAVELKSYLMMNSVRFCWLVVDAATIKDAYEHLPRRRTEYDQLLETASKEVVEKVLVTVCGPYSLPPRDEQSVSLAIKSILDKKDKGFMVWLKGGKVQMGTDILLEIMSSITIARSSNLKASNPAGVEGARKVSSVPGSSRGDEQAGQGMVTSQSTNLPDVSNLPIFTTRQGERVRVLVKAHLRYGRICEEKIYHGWKVPEYIRTNLLEEYSETRTAELLLFLDNNGVLQCRVTPRFLLV